MIRILPLEKADAAAIVEWNEGKSADFLSQWSGRGYEYPITEGQISSRIDAQPSSDYRMYRIDLDGETAGTISLIYMNPDGRWFETSSGRKKPVDSISAGFRNSAYYQV